MEAMCSSTNESEVATETREELRSEDNRMREAPPDFADRGGGDVACECLMLSGHGSKDMMFYPGPHEQLFYAGDGTEWMLYWMDESKWFSLAQIINGQPPDPEHGFLPGPGKLLGWTYVGVDKTAKPPPTQTLSYIYLTGHETNNQPMQPGVSGQLITAGDGSQWMFEWPTENTTWFTMVEHTPSPGVSGFAMLNGLSGQRGSVGVCGWSFLTYASTDWESVTAPPGVQVDGLGEPLGSIVLRGHGIDAPLFPNVYVQPITAPDGTFWNFYWASSTTEWFSIAEVENGVPQRPAYAYLTGEPGQVGRVGTWMFETKDPVEEEVDRLIPHNLIFCRAPDWDGWDDCKAGDATEDDELYLELNGYGGTLVVRPSMGPVYHCAPDGSQWFVHMGPNGSWISIQVFEGGRPRHVHFRRGRAPDESVIILNWNCTTRRGSPPPPGTGVGSAQFIELKGHPDASGNKTVEKKPPNIYSQFFTANDGTDWRLVWIHPSNQWFSMTKQENGTYSHPHWGHYHKLGAGSPNIDEWTWSLLS